MTPVSYTHLDVYKRQVQGHEHKHLDLLHVVRAAGDERAGSELGRLKHRERVDLAVDLTTQVAADLACRADCMGHRLLRILPRRSREPHRLRRLHRRRTQDLAGSDHTGHIRRVRGLLARREADPEPVSYTHLDVYKRQALGSRFRRNDEGLSKS